MGPFKQLSQEMQDRLGNVQVRLFTDELDCSEVGSYPEPPPGRASSRTVATDQIEEESLELTQ